MNPQSPDIVEAVRLDDVRVLHIFISAAHNYVGYYGGPPGEHPTLDVPEVRCVAGQGLEGDRYFGGKPDAKGQVTFFAAEAWRDVQNQFHLPDLPASAFRRNVITEGLDLNRLIGKRFVLQGITFQGTEECRPCSWMDRAAAPGAEAHLRGHGGLRARILTDGLLRVSA